MARLASALLVALVGLGLVGAAVPARPVSAAPDGFAYGILVDTTDARGMRLAAEAGFTHAKMMLRWEAVEPSPENYAWNASTENDFDNIMKAARNEGMLLVIRVDGVPGWAGGSPANANLDAVRSFYENLARYGAGTVAAYEILDEPNLDREWGAAPNPAGYTAFLKAAYRGVKAGDPSVLVLGGGPAPGTGNNPGATIEDVDFLNGMYDAGAKGLMDALAVHNYGGNTEPERDPTTCTICFRRAELYRDVMVGHGDAATPVWLTEWGYLLDAGQNMGQYDWMKVSADQQADYLVRAYRYASQNWPWLAGSLLYNIDGAASPYQNYGGFDAKAWFSILNADYSPRPAWLAIQTMRGGPEAIAARRSAAAAVASAPPQGGRKQAKTTKPPASETAAAPAPAPTDAAAAAAAQPPTPDRLRVAGTDGQGVNLRAGPSLTASRVKTVPEGALLSTTGDTRQADGHTWWNVRDAQGANGWVAAEFVAPA